MTDAAHNRSIVVWDVPTAVVRSETFAFKVGLKCEVECRPQDWALEVRDHDGTPLAKATVSDEAWRGTSALYHAEFELVAPDAEGLFSWQVVALIDEREQTLDEPKQAVDADDAASHAEAGASFNLRVVPAADCSLKVIAIDRESQQPVAGLKVVVHPYRAVTDEHGVAELSLPKGQYRVFVSGKNFFPFRVDGELTSDQTIRAELDVELGPSDAELWS